MYAQLDDERDARPAAKVFIESCQGGRKYMEDCHSVAYQEKARKQTLSNVMEYIYFGVFDGHGGKEAAIFARENLVHNIVSQRNFWSNDDDDVSDAIKAGFISTHYAMMREIGKWPKTSLGLPSTSGTTASVCFVMRDKYYIGHVGDSRIVLIREEDETTWKSVSLTNDHKPDTPSERSRIVNAGGKIMNKSGVERVVWNRPKCGHKGPVRRSTHIDEIPFLAVARSLGDLWSYNSVTDTFVVSPVPDVTILPVSEKDVCLLLASDGLWNMIGEHESRDLLYDFHQGSTENTPLECLQENKKIFNPAQLLVDYALQRWNINNLRADNITVVVAFFDRSKLSNCERNVEHLDECLVSSTPTILSSSCGEYCIPVTDHLSQNVTSAECFLLDSGMKSVSAHRISCQYTQLKYSSENAIDLVNSSLYTPEPFQQPLQSINDNESNCKLPENFEAASDFKSLNRVGNSESNSWRDNLLHSENSVSDICVNNHQRLHRCVNERKGRTVRPNLIMQASLRKPFHNGRVKKRKWKMLSNSPPAKRLRSSSWSRAKRSLPSILTRAVAASLLTRSRLRAIKCAGKPL